MSSEEEEHRRRSRRRAIGAVVCGLFTVIVLCGCGFGVFTWVDSQSSYNTSIYYMTYISTNFGSPTFVKSRERGG